MHMYIMSGGGGGSPALFLHVHVDVAVRGFVNIVSNRATGFHRQTKLFELNFFTKRNVSPSCSNQEGKSFSEPANLPSARPLTRPPSCGHAQVHFHVSTLFSTRDL